MSSWLKRDARNRAVRTILQAVVATVLVPAGDAVMQVAQRAFVDSMSRTDGVAAAFTPPQPLRDGLAVVTVIPTSAPQDQATTQLIERLRGFDSIVSWYGDGRPAFRDTVARLGLPFQFFPALPSGCHAVDFYLNQVGMSGGVTPYIACPPGDEEFVVIHPFASDPRKRWPIEKFREVARQLKMQTHWCAGPEEPLDGAVRIDDLYELGCWLARARLYIGNDSGISHLAAAVGTPSIVLFGPTDPAIWAPRGMHVRVLDRMESVEPDDVLAAIMDSHLWSPHGAPS